MHQSFHRFSELFAQLGLDTDEQAIMAFIAYHAPLDPTVRLEEASFWTPSQAAWLREEWHGDADWAEQIDRLSLALRGEVCLG